MKGCSRGLVSGVAFVLVGCGASASSYVASNTTLGKVVVYRNGVAYFERSAEAVGGSLKLSVPEDKVDDFLKSLSVVDAQTGEPAPVSYPASATSGTVEMKVAVAQPGRKLRISYVTEAPSWKSSYRVVVGKNGKVDVQGWAIVDNTSGEDWLNVKLGVGSSSAMSFRFNLKAPMFVQRETLHSNDRFAIAPPTGGASHGSPGKRVFGDIDDGVLALGNGASPDEPSESTIVLPSGASALSMDASASPTHEASKLLDKKQGAARGRHAPPMAPAATTSSSGPDAGAGANDARSKAIATMARAIAASPTTIFHVEGYASVADPNKQQGSLARANRLREQLIAAGVNPKQLVAVGRGEREGRSGGARVVEAPEHATSPGESASASVEASNALSPPVGTSHFESASPMSVPKSTSAMISVLRAETEGEVVYLYDPDGARANAQFPFRTLRFKNPTESMLESGPVTVFGDGRFIGEGLAEPIPAKAIAFVPFALDRQVVVDRELAERDAIARIVTVQRGVFSTEIQHTKQVKYTLFNRSQERAIVYVRHAVPQGFTITKSPDASSSSAADERLGATRLFRVVVEPNAKKEVVVEEATPVFRSTDIRTDAGRDLVRAYISGAAMEEGPLRAQVSKLLELHTEMTNLESKIAGLHDQMKEQRQRMDELHSQIFTLKAVKTSGPLMGQLERMLSSVSDAVSKSTIDVVKLQESLMLAKVRFQTGVSQLSLEPEGSK